MRPQRLPNGNILVPIQAEIEGEPASCVLGAIEVGRGDRGYEEAEQAVERHGSDSEERHNR